jgi:hypothetical protein
MFKRRPGVRHLHYGIAAVSWVIGKEALMRPGAPILNNLAFDGAKVKSTVLCKRRLHGNGKTPAIAQALASSRGHGFLSS